MKLHIAVLTLLACLLAASPVWAQQKPPAGRSSLDPASRNKLAVTMSRARIDPDSTRADVEKTVVSGPTGKSCTTNVASTPEPSKSDAGGKYGSSKNKEQVVVVQGPVINICK